MYTRKTTMTRWINRLIERTVSLVSALHTLPMGPMQIMLTSPLGQAAIRPLPASVFAAGATPRHGGRKLVLGLAAMVALVTASPESASAVVAEADHTVPTKLVGGAQKGGTSDFEVYANGDNAQGKPQPVNADSDHIATKPLKESATLKPPPMSEGGEKSKIMGVYGPPIIAVRNAPKLDPIKSGYDEEWVRAFSGEAFAVAKYLPLTGPSVSARGVVNRGFNLNVRGTAAAKASDPIPISPGDYPYRPTIRAMIQRDYDDDFATVEFAAGDSDGLLWALSITPEGPLSSNQASVDLVINAGRLGGLVDRDGHPLDPSAIVKELRAALTVENGFVILNDHSLFPDGTRYIVDAETDYDFNASAGVSSLLPMHRTE